MGMTVARITEISASSMESFDDAVKVGIARAAKTLKNVSGAWVKDQEVSISDGKITEYRVKLKITFVLEE
jgi:flavin-binding protein dodecin